jgi:hypothetical protein
MRERMSRESTELIKYYSPEACAAGIAEAALSVFHNRDDGGAAWMSSPPAAASASEAELGE